MHRRQVYTVHESGISKKKKKSKKQKKTCFRLGGREIYEGTDMYT